MYSQHITTPAIEKLHAPAVLDEVEKACISFVHVLYF